MNRCVFNIFFMTCFLNRCGLYIYIFYYMYLRYEVQGSDRVTGVAARSQGVVRSGEKHSKVPDAEFHKFSTGREFMKLFPEALTNFLKKNN